MEMVLSESDNSYTFLPMHTKTILSASALFMGILGIGLSFLPDEIVSFFNMPPSKWTAVFLQMWGSIYLGFAMLNWMSKGVRIGGIFNKPLAVGNFMHFGAGGIALAKAVTVIEIHQAIGIGITVVYGVFALAFGYIFRTSPKETI